MVVYRITHSTFKNDLSGEGARLYGGRWNRKGFSCLYTSEHAALSMLELVVHQTAQTLPEKMMLLTLDINDSSLIETINEENLPKGWNHLSGSKEAQDVGSTWLKEKRSPLLKVPSVVCPYAWNYLINPALISAENLRITNQFELMIDGRIKQ